jgi:NAD(P)H-quinone oxidoreductase subunit 5
VCDVGLLLAAILVHHWAGSGEYADIAGGGAWPAGHVTLSSAQATAVGLLLVFAAMGKSAQIPFSGWLPRAMEGPTPSSAIFYGALSVHAGAYVLLRAAPLLEQAPVARAALIIVGLLSAVHATLVGRAQTDIKSALAYATMTQVALIFVEIGLGLHFFALLHLMGHALVRTLQFLRAPSLLHEHHQLEAAVGHHLARTGTHLERALPPRTQRWLYRFALERGYHDSILWVFCVEPTFRFFLWLDRRERGWIRRLGGDAP